uniref:Fiber protein Fb34 n=1 Tax=Anthurium amnicola TaxID=1678845 RepID=A0A1D1YGC8_9ARAE
MAVSILVVAAVSFLHFLAFVFAIGAEMRRNTGKVMKDEYDERTYCGYGSGASTTYGLAAAVLLIVSHAVLNAVTRCLCCGRGLAGGPRRRAICSFLLAWLTFLAAEACLVAGSARNAYHTKYLGYYLRHDLTSCAALRKGVFGAAAALILLSLVASLVYYWVHSLADTAGWQKHRNEGDLGMTDFNPPREEFVGVKS